VSKRLAKELMVAKSAEAFSRARAGRVDWRAFATLKLEVDKLVHSDLNAASHLVNRIEQLSALSDDPLSKAFAKASRARLLHLLGQHADANPLYADAVKVLRTFNLAREAAIVQKQQVDALTHIGRYGEALRAARAARQVLAETDRVQLAQLETNVGNIYYMLDRYKKALAHYDIAHEALQDGGDPKMLALIDLNRANVFTELDKPEEALALLAGAARAFDRSRQFVLAAQARYHIAYLEFLRGHYNIGLKGYTETRERLTELGSVHLVAWCDLEIAEIFLALNAFDDALQNASSAHARFRGLDMPYESARAQMISGQAATGMGQFEEAYTELSDARAVFAANRNAIFTATADCYLADLAIRRGDPTQASRLAGRALRIFVREGLVPKAACARLLAARAAYQAGQRTRAKRGARAALRSIEGTFAPAVAYMCHHLIGRVERDEGNKRAGLASLRRSVALIEMMRGGIAADEFKATFLGDKMEVYEDAIRACLDEDGGGSIEEAFRLVESAKSRGLADLLASYLRDAPPRRLRKGGVEHETRASLLKLIEELNWHSSHAKLEDEKGGQRRATVADRYGREVARCERKIALLFRRLEAEGLPFDDGDRLRAASVAELQDTLEPGETAIEYFTTMDEISAFVITRGTVEVVRTFASKRDVEQTIGAFKFQIEKFNYGAGFADGYFAQLNQAANQHLGVLYRSLFAPIERFVTNDRLIVIPHGALHYVPFHALLNRSGYLVDQYEISYSPSAAVLRLCRKMAQQTQTLNVNSRISGSRGDMVALGLAQHDTPEVAGEIRALGALFPNAVTLTGDRATRDNLMRAAPKARYLHLASHGYFRRDNPMFSFLRLADSNLNFYSLMDLKLKAEMVTLSACHTGVNRVFPGDELHGLMRGFMRAGAPSLVASLWATGDASTAELMKQMYSRISAGVSKRGALRSAQLAVKDEYGHPYYWAPFILMGNPN
jgi:CHAT domain-containing protein